MRLRHLRVKNFRGIKELDWALPTGFVCLVGPGDAGKSTILDAIELVLHPRYNPALDDSDFYRGATDEAIIIEATVSHLPDELVREQRLGLYLRGVSPDGTIHDEPQDGDEEALTIRLTVEASLEPTWTLFNQRQGDGHSLSTRDRQRLGCTRLGAAMDWHLTWARGSLLSRITDKTDEQSRVLADAGRQARKNVAGGDLVRLSEAAKAAAALAAELGVAPERDFRPQLDAKEASLGAGALALHDGDVPMRRAGLGTRRLLGLALQRSLGTQGGVTLVDEVEHALEPHRVRRLVRTLRPQGGKPSEKSVSLPGSTILTSHCATVLTELRAEDLCVVRRDQGIANVQQVDSALQDIVRANPEAFLARRIIVCEGKTEIGLCRGLDAAQGAKGKCFAYSGIAYADAGGCTKVGKTAAEFAKLGYKVCVLADSDRDLDMPPAALSAQGITVFQWEGRMSTEQRLATDLPREVLDQVVRLAFDEWGEESIRDQISNHLPQNTGRLKGDPSDWASVDEQVLRQAIGDAASGKKPGAKPTSAPGEDKPKGWFKRVDLGEAVGLLVATHLDRFADKDAAKKVKGLLSWVQQP
jgi:energy-coupling factor transporter ATP-binding protein EcfA2